MDAFQMEGDSRQEIEGAAVRLLATREHSRQELERKLSKRFDLALLDEVLADLVRRGLQSDDRFTEQYVAQRIRKGYGPLRIRVELRDKGVDGSLPDEYLDAGSHDWWALMQEAAERKYGLSPAQDQKEMARRARFLEYRGFPSEMIREYLFD